MSKKLIKIPTKKFGTITAELTTEQIPNLGYDGKPNPGQKSFTLYIAECKIKKSCYVSTAGSAEEAIKSLRAQLDNEGSGVARYVPSPDQAAPSDKHRIKRR
jgi:hypothetical protein